MRLAIVSLLLLTTTACSPAQQRFAGAGIATAGVAATYIALDSMVPSCRQRTEPHNVCVSHSPTIPPSVGFPIAFAGIGAVVLGGLIVATASETRRPPREAKPAAPTPPEQPAPLAESDAVGMALAHLMLAKRLDGNTKPAKLLAVDDTHSHLNIQGRHAQLWNLRVQNASDDDWLTLGACFEYQHEWSLTSLGATPGCAR